MSLPIAVAFQGAVPEEALLAAFAAQVAGGTWARLMGREQPPDGEIRLLLAVDQPTLPMVTWQERDMAAYFTHSGVIAVALREVDPSGRWAAPGLARLGHVIAHEVTHLVQAARGALQEQPVSARDLEAYSADPLEREAREAEVLPLSAIPAALAAAGVRIEFRVVPARYIRWQHIRGAAQAAASDVLTAVRRIGMRAPTSSSASPPSPPSRRS